MASSLADRIETSLSHIKALEPDRQRANIPELVDLKRNLENSLSIASQEDLSRLADLNNRFATLVGPLIDDLVRACMARVRELQETLPRAQTLPEVEAAEASLAQANREWEWISVLRPESITTPAMRTLYDQAAALTRRMSSVRRFVEVRSEVMQFAKRSAGLEQTLPDDAVLLAKEAVITANAALSSGFEWNDSERDALRLLWGERQRTYDDLRQRHEVPVTRLEGEELVFLIIGWAERVGKDPNQLVTYFTSDELTASTGVMPIQKALEVARQKLLRGLWRNKVEEYVKAAEKRLDEHRPREALAEIRKWQELPGLYDERVGVRVPDNLNVRIKQTEERIKPDLQAFNAAEAAVLRARLELQSDAVAAYRSWQTANAAYPHIAELQSLLLEIQQKAREEAARLLGEVGNSLAAEEWGLCETRFNRLDALFTVDVNLRAELQRELDNHRSIYDRIERLLPGKPRLSFRDELALLQNLQSEVPHYWQGWSRLAARLAMLEARGSVQDMTAAGQALCRPDVILGQLEAVYIESVRLQQDPVEGLTQQDERQLNQLVNRLKAWVGYAAARDVIEQAEVIPASESDDPALDVLFAPDLSVASQGIADAAGDLVANQAVGERNLRRRLQRLQENDAPVRQLLKEAPVTLSKAGVQDTRDLLGRVNHLLARPTSSRAELLLLQQSVRRWLVDRLVAEVEAILTAARATRFSQLDVAKLETYLVELNALPQQMRPPAALLEKLNAAVRIANAHQLLRFATEGHASWEDARAAWDVAAQAAYRDADLATFCRVQARHCYREQTILNVRRAGSPEAAEGLLAGLLHDEAFRDDWQLFLMHGRQALLAAQSLLRSQPQAANDPGAASYLARAREALNRGRDAAATSGAAVNETAAIRETLGAVTLWETFASSKGRICDVLAVGGAQLRSDQCREAAVRYQEATATLVLNETQHLLQSFWDFQRNGARSVLERRFNQETNEFGKVDALLGMTFLFPEDGTLVTRLVGLVTEGLRLVKQEVVEVCFDSSAGRFLERYARQHRGVPPPDRSIAEHQLADVMQVVSRVDIMKQVLEIVRQQVGEQPNRMGSLETERDQLADWVIQLTQLSAAQSEVTHLVTFGMKDPNHFPIARYILWLGAEAPNHQRIPPAFRDHGHPTYRWLVEFVNTTEQRRASQEHYRRRIEVALKYEQADSAEALAVAPPASDLDVVAELRQMLSQPIRRYPLEYVLSLIDQMVQDEPDDLCNLQATMQYRDPDDSVHVYVSAPQIRLAVERKVGQVCILRKWLSQFNVGSVPTQTDCPGIVDWPRVRQTIMALRDRNPDGLKEALAECKKVEKGDERELYRGVWSLQKAKRALSYDSMVAVLRNATGDTSLCSAAASINRQRDSLYQEIVIQIAACKGMVDDINERIRRFAPAWQEVQRTWNSLVSQPHFVLAGDRANRFREAATEFASICPNWSEFQNILRQANQRGLHHEALRQDWLR